MKKAVARVSIKLNRIVYPKGTIFCEPFPAGVEAEIKSGSGTIVEISTPVEGDSMKRPEIEAITPPSPDVDSEDDLLDEIAGIDIDLEPEDLEPEPEKEPPVPETEAERKARLIAEALDIFGVKISARKKLSTIEEEVFVLRSGLETENKESLGNI